jgi:DNA-binding IclR family transcriptional regulator
MRDTMQLSTNDLIGRVRGEFLEMPGLQLTTDQARRLWGLDALTCQRLLRVLVDARFLSRTPDGRYRRAES